ncbi:MAG: hypothetical protein COT71_00425 [Candidatus Andersenbacteria bacterium CG10_big_fil_rev_8_21_14_0_10_54_11]|uniref:ABC transporter permease n=1 Tax=Candidatus Andersenbacteria bacterium CG10_big_fil_rev_8_21_14_0_10_54_11 TaxID=1974485 RepID=A0A2M6X0E7_9BACT|nr:MAG: hypothetical protein COT71_00425 [Candidatus Andersenbacteria bacterium CG10_big_fil_rev_8_21_14_0_10_54_11]
MTLLVRQISRLCALEWSRILQYRADAILWLTAESTIPLISLAIWHTVSAASPTGPAARDVLTYFVVIIIIGLTTESWNGAFMARDILNGDIVKDLMKPFPVFWRYLADNLSEKAMKLLFAVPVTLIVLTTLADRFTPAIYEPIRLVYFLASLALAAVISFLTDHLIGTLAFWLEDVFQIRRYKVILEQVGTGVLIPFAFMPPLAVMLLGFLPFRFIISAPAEILLNQPVQTTVPQLFIFQSAWIAVLLVMEFGLWRRGLKRYVVPGQ